MSAGGCRCGAVRFQATGAPLNVRVCHCRPCQQATGQPFFARALYRRMDVEILGEMARHPSSPELDRGFCPRCGTPLFALRDDRGVIGVALGAFDDAQSLKPTEHVWVSRKLDWLDLADSLPQYAEGAPQA